MTPIMNPLQVTFSKVIDRRKYRINCLYEQKTYTYLTVLTDGEVLKRT